MERVLRLAQEMREVRQVALVAIEQAVEAHRGVVMRGAGEGAEAVAGVEARFAHGAIARIEIATEPVAAKPGARAQQTGMNVATGLLEARRFCRIGMLRAFDEKGRALGAGMRRRAHGSRRGSKCCRRPSPARGLSRNRSSGRDRCGRPGVPGASTWNSPFARRRRHVPASSIACARPAGVAGKLAEFSNTRRIIAVRNGGCERVR